MRSVLLTLVLALVATVAVSVQAAEQAAKQAEPGAVEWFQDARFGLFVHWGVYSVLGKGEWVMHNTKMTVEEYEKLPPQFNPMKFDPKEWVAMVKNAGQRYITITSRHHDGFSMFDSKTSDYNIVEKTPYGKDEGTAYLHVLKVPDGGVLKLGAPPDGTRGVTTLDGKAIEGAKVEGGHLVVPIPEAIRNEIDTIVAVKLK